MAKRETTNLGELMASMLECECGGVTTASVGDPTNFVGTAGSASIEILQTRPVPTPKRRKPTPRRKKTVKQMKPVKPKGRK